MKKEKRRLVFQALTYLDIIETRKNQPVVNLIRGILYELLHSD